MIQERIELHHYYPINCKRSEKASGRYVINVSGFIKL